MLVNEIFFAICFWNVRSHSLHNCLISGYAGNIMIPVLFPYVPAYPEIALLNVVSLLPFNLY